MLAWRLCRAAFADLAGEGARRFGGRWNTPGRPLVYAAESAALAVLEVRVHLDLPMDLLPDDYVLLTLDLDDLLVTAIDVLPDRPADAGDAWLREARTPLLRVPSAIVPECSNLLLNPAHPEAVGARIAGQRPFAFDRRLGSTTRKCFECPVRANRLETHATSSEGFSRSGLRKPGAGCASSVQM